MKHKNGFLILAAALLAIMAPEARAADLLVSGAIDSSQSYDSVEGIVFDGAILTPTANVSALSTYEAILKPGTRIEAGARLVVNMKDNDGLSNRCEMTYFGDLTHDPNMDDDADGLTNLQECQAGSMDPGNPDTDADGVIDSCEAPFDATAPLITLTGQNPVHLCLNQSYTDAGATATDDCIGDLSSQIAVVSTVNTAVSGTYTVTYNVQDGAGNSAAQVIRTVYVDVQAPVITLSGETPLVLCVGTPYAEPGATATDNCDGDLSGSMVLTGSVDPNTAGNYTVTYNVSDTAGNAAQPATRTVVIMGAGQTVQIDTSYGYDAIGRLRSITKQVQ